MRVDRPSTSSDYLGAALGFALPDADRSALHGGLAAERADVACVLGDFHLLNLLTERGTVASTILTDNADLSRALSHFESLSEKDCYFVDKVDTGFVKSKKATIATDDDISCIIRSFTYSTLPKITDKAFHN